MSPDYVYIIGIMVFPEKSNYFIVEQTAIEKVPVKPV